MKNIIELVIRCQINRKKKVQEMCHVWQSETHPDVVAIDRFPGIPGRNVGAQRSSSFSFSFPTCLFFSLFCSFVFLWSAIDQRLAPPTLPFFSEAVSQSNCVG
jgi:hypothetical protein